MQVISSIENNLEKQGKNLFSLASGGNMQYNPCYQQKYCVLDGKYAKCIVYSTNTGRR